MTRMHLPKPAQLRGPTGFAGFLTVVVFLLFSGAIVTTLVAVAIWPGEVKLVAPLFCSDAQPDPFVVSDTYNPAPGETTIDFTLYCMGPNGDATDKGYFLPFLATMALNIAALVAIGVIMGLIRRLRHGPGGSARRAATDGSGSGGHGMPTAPEQRTGPSAAPPGSTAGPFVD